MEEEAIINWLAGLIQAKNNVGQGVTVEYLFGYVDSAKGLIDALRTPPPQIETK